jgi:hypothetical protein
MSASSTSPPTPFGTSARSMSRSTCTLCGNTWPSMMSASCTYQRYPSSHTSSRRVWLLQCFQCFSPVSTFTVPRVLTVGDVRNMLYYSYIGLEPPPMSGLARPIGDVTWGGGKDFLGFPCAAAPGGQAQPPALRFSGGCPIYICTYPNAIYHLTFGDTSLSNINHTRPWNEKIRG